MSKDFQFETKLEYEPAGVGFNVSLKVPSGGQEAAFRVARWTSSKVARPSGVT